MVGRAGLICQAVIFVRKDLTVRTGLEGTLYELLPGMFSEILGDGRQGH